MTRNFWILLSIIGVLSVVSVLSVLTMHHVVRLRMYDNVVSQSPHRLPEETPHRIDHSLSNLMSKRVLCLDSQNLDEIVKEKRRRGALAIGVDSKRNASNGHVLAGRLASQGIADGSVDVIFLYSFESILNDKNFVRQTAALLADDGSLVIEIEEDARSADDASISESQRKGIASLNSEYQVVRNVRKASDFDRKTFIWSITCAKHLSSGTKHNLRTTSDSILVLGDTVAAVSKKARELRRRGSFVFAMIPNAPPNSGLLTCSKDIGSIFFRSMGPRRWVI